MKGFSWTSSMRSLAAWWHQPGTTRDLVRLNTRLRLRAEVLARRLVLGLTALVVCTIALMSLGVTSLEARERTETPRPAVARDPFPRFRFRDRPPYLLPSSRRRRFFDRLWRDFAIQAQEPVWFARRNPLGFSLGVVGLGAMIGTDHLTLPALAPEDWKEGGRLHIFRGLSTYGEAIYALPIVGAVGIIGYAGDRPYEQESFLMATEALITSGTWTTIIKYMAGRERPFQREHQRSDWNGPFSLWGEQRSHNRRYVSFPSGHSSAIFSLATVFSLRYSRPLVIPVIAYTIAGAVAYSRMVVDDHWPSDVVAGAALGLYCGWQVVRDNSPGWRGGERRAERSGLRLDAVTPFVDRGRYGVTVTVSW